MRAVRSQVSLLSLASCGIFRTSVEDNVAVAAPFEVTPVAVREACTCAGVHAYIMTLPVGQRVRVVLVGPAPFSGSAAALLV